MIKVIAGSAVGGLLGPLGGMVGAASGLIWGIAEIANTPRLDGVDPPETPALQSTIDTVGSNGLVIYPKGLPPVGVGPGNGREWRSDNVSIDGRQYFFTVDRATQVLWGDDPDGQGSADGAQTSRRIRRPADQGWRFQNSGSFSLKHWYATICHREPLCCSV